MGPQKFKNKPVIIEAIQWLGTNSDEIYAFMGKRNLEWDPPGKGLYIHTLNGIMRAHSGDWVIKGTAGGFYPCNPDIFEATYERA